MEENEVKQDYSQSVPVLETYLIFDWHLKMYLEIENYLHLGVFIMSEKKALFILFIFL